MYNLLIGPPGGGKSYEAVVYHVLPTLESGRKVITNLPLNVPEFAKLDARFPALIELRTESKGQGVDAHVFGDVADYGSDWRDPKTGQGPLYVIDECHKALPRGGTQRKVEEWFAEHRHEGCDLLLITQSHGKISKAITDSVQVCYRVKKMTTFGRSDRYIRKVQDGVRGEVMSVTEREYESRYYRLYKSHTRSIASVFEADAKDINPAFAKWMRAGYIVVALPIVFMVGRYLLADDADAKEPSQPAAARTKEHGEGVASAPAAGAKPVIRDSAVWRIEGTWGEGGGVVYLVASSAGVVRLAYPDCETDIYGQPTCMLNGERVTYFSGPPRDAGILQTIFAGPVPNT